MNLSHFKLNFNKKMILDFKRIKKLHKVKLKNQWRLKTIILHFRRKRIIKTNIKTCLFYKI